MSNTDVAAATPTVGDPPTTSIDAELKYLRHVSQFQHNLLMEILRRLERLEHPRQEDVEDPTHD